MLRCDDDGDGRSDREVTVPMPIFHVLGLLSDLGDRYWVLPDRTAGGHIVSGFASRDDRGVVRVLLYAHDARDTQSRSGATFDVALELAGLGGSGRVSVREYRFDRDHNSPFRLARALRDRPARAGRSGPGAPGVGAAGPRGRRRVGAAAGAGDAGASSAPRPCRRPRRS